MTNTKKRFFVPLLAALLAAPAASADWQLPANRYNLPENFTGMIVNIINWLLAFASLLAVLVIVYAGIVYTASTGDQDRVRDAKKAAKYAIMGLAMAGIAFATVRVIVITVLHE